MMAKPSDAEIVMGVLASMPSPSDSPKDCPHFDPPIERAWCARCQGSTLASDDPEIPLIHDGRHGRTCGRCLARHRREIRAVRLDP